MNENTKIAYRFAKMYEFVKDITTICAEHSNDYECVIENMTTKHAVNMCLVQMGEQAGMIRDISKELYQDERFKLYQIKGMRDRITHTYGSVDYGIVKQVLKTDIPYIKKLIEENIHMDILNNPYLLYETEYDDYLIDNPMPERPEKGNVFAYNKEECNFHTRKGR